MNEKDLIRNMMKDTFKPNKDLVRRKQQGIEDINVGYDTTKKCFFLTNKQNKTLEIPENFGLFDSINRPSVKLSVENDDKDLLSMISLFLGRELSEVRLHITHTVASEFQKGLNAA